jgi:hypothetical protein
MSADQIGLFKMSSPEKSSAFPGEKPLSADRSGISGRAVLNADIKRRSLVIPVAEYLGVVLVLCWRL